MEQMPQIELLFLHFGGGDNQDVQNLMMELFKEETKEKVCMWDEEGVVEEKVQLVFHTWQDKEEDKMKLNKNSNAFD